jgi:DNA-binding beta-propeller fold protein YncE
MCATGAGSHAQTGPGPPAALSGVPIFKPDPSWPVLPSDFTWGQVIGIFADGQGHVWTSSRSRISEWDAQGKQLQSWDARGPEGNWSTIHGLFVDHNGFVWTNARESHLTVKFTRTGQVAMVIGKYNQTGGSNDTTLMGRPSEIWVDPTDNELFVADGYGNRRIVVFDAETGAYKRHWGAYGAAPDDADPGPYDPAAPPAKQFRSVTCVKIAKDGLVYVCDRRNNRVQVFQKDGKFVKEAFVSKTTRGEGAVWDVAFSNDPQQRYLYVADGQDQKVFVLDRISLEQVSSFGGGGRWPGGFFGVGSVAVDSKGNVYTGENLEGKRLQKFIFKGLR